MVDASHAALGKLEAMRCDPERLAAVSATELLDTPAEESFDRLTRLAAKLIGVPATFLSLVDESRDFYKSFFGFGEALAAARQIENRTFCHYSMMSEGPLVIPDTLDDPVFRHVPTVQSLGVRAYAGIPLRTVEGYTLGSFCAIDVVPRTWSTLDIEILTELAASAFREIKLRVAVREAENQVQRAQEVSRERERLLAIVAHDLRTPLGIVKIGAHVIRLDPSGPKSLPLLGRIEHAVESMERLIEDLLESARIDAGGGTIRPMRLRGQKLLEDAHVMLAPFAERHGCRLVPNTDAELPEVRADYERMLRVFSNLVVNAVKFSPAGGDILLRGECRGPMVRFSVTDSGIGMSAEDQARIFGSFWQADNADRRGAGLGLAIVKSIVAAHDGTLGVESAPGRGSCFHFDLPLA